MSGLVYLLLFLALSGHSSALYCICKDGVSETLLQKAIDFACGAGADCTPIIQNGVCYQPNTVKDHCSYAVNSYYQRKVSSGATCDFNGAAATSSNPPSTATSTCVYPSSASTAGTPNTTPTTGGTTTTPTTGTTTPTTGTTNGITPTPFIGGAGSIGPTGSGFDNSGVSSIQGITSLLFGSISSGLLLVLWG